jgi:hypothetical protein
MIKRITIYFGLLILIHTGIADVIIGDIRPRESNMSSRTDKINVMFGMLNTNVVTLSNTTYIPNIWKTVLFKTSLQTFSMFTNTSMLGVSTRGITYFPTSGVVNISNETDILREYLYATGTGSENNNLVDHAEYGEVAYRVRKMNIGQTAATVTADNFIRETLVNGRNSTNGVFFTLKYTNSTTPMPITIPINVLYPIAPMSLFGNPNSSSAVPTSVEILTNISSPNVASNTIMSPATQREYIAKYSEKYYGDTIASAPIAGDGFGTFSITNIVSDVGRYLVFFKARLYSNLPTEGNLLFASTTDDILLVPYSTPPPTETSFGCTTGYVKFEGNHMPIHDFYGYVLTDSNGSIFYRITQNPLEVNQFFFTILTATKVLE